MNFDNTTQDEDEELNKQFLNKKTKRYLLTFVYGFIFGAAVMELFILLSK